MEDEPSENKHDIQSSEHPIQTDRADDNIKFETVIISQNGPKTKEENGIADVHMSNSVSQTRSEAAMEDKSGNKQDLIMVDNGPGLSQVPESELVTKDHVPETKLPESDQDVIRHSCVPEKTVEPNVPSQKDDLTRQIMSADSHTGENTVIKITVATQAEISHQQQHVMDIKAGTTDNVIDKLAGTIAEDSSIGKDAISLQCVLDCSTGLGDSTKDEGIGNVNPLGEVPLTGENGLLKTTKITSEDHVEEPDMDLSASPKVIVRENLVVSMNQMTENHLDQHHMDIDHHGQAHATVQETTDNVAEPDSTQQVSDDHIGKSGIVIEENYIGENIIETQGQATDDHTEKHNMEIDIGTAENDIEKSDMGVGTPSATKQDAPNHKSNIPQVQNNENIYVEEDIIKAVCEVIEDRELTGSRPVPVLVKGKEVNLLKLFLEVKSCGGYDKTSIWPTIAKDLGFGLECGPVLKLVYLKYLKALENRSLIANHDNKSPNSVSKARNGDSRTPVSTSSKKKKLAQSEDASAITVNGDKNTSGDSEALVSMLEWVKRLALNPGDPKRGQGTQKSKWNEARIVKCEELIHKVRTVFSVQPSEQEVTDHPSESVLKKRGRPKTPRRGSAKKNRLSSS